MSTTKHSEFQENFLRQPSKVDDIIKFLGEMEKSNKMEWVSWSVPLLNV